MPWINPNRQISNRHSVAPQQHRSAALDAIVRVQLAANAPQLLESLLDATAAIGATASIYTVLIPEGGTEPSSFSLFACHPALAQHLCHVGVPLDHAWLQPAGMPLRSKSDARSPILGPRDAESLELARRYGFKSCLLVPTPSGADPERVEVLCLGSERRDAFEDGEAHVTRTLARALAGELHDWVNRQLSHSLRRSARIRPLDIQLLRLEWQGLTTKEISLRTGLSTATVDSRFCRISERMQCATRRASARRAAAYGLLEGM